MPPFPRTGRGEGPVGYRGTDVDANSGVTHRFSSSPSRHLSTPNDTARDTVGTPPPLHRRTGPEIAPETGSSTKPA